MRFRYQRSDVRGREQRLHDLDNFRMSKHHADVRKWNLRMHADNHSVLWQHRRNVWLKWSVGQPMDVRDWELFGRGLHWLHHR